MEKEIKKIMYSSDEAAQQVTVTGWKSSDGRFYGNDEHLARWAGCTHTLCECGKEMSKSYTKCKTCRFKASVERYNALPFREWDLEEPVCTWDSDKYFFNVEDLEEYMHEHELETINLLFCEENHLQTIDNDYWSDVFPEDSDGDLPKEVEVALQHLNDVLRKQPPFSYSAGKTRTSYTTSNPQPQHQTK